MHKKSYPHFGRPPDQAVLNIWMYGTLDKNDIKTEWYRFKQRFSINDNTFYNNTNINSRANDNITNNQKVYENVSSKNFPTQSSNPPRDEKSQSNMGTNQSNNTEIYQNHTVNNTVLINRKKEEKFQQNVGIVEINGDEHTTYSSYYFPLYNISHYLFGHHLVSNPTIYDRATYCLFALICLALWCHYQYGGCGIIFSEERVQNQPYQPLQTSDYDDREYVLEIDVDRNASSTTSIAK